MEQNKLRCAQNFEVSHFKIGGNGAQNFPERNLLPEVLDQVRLITFGKELKIISDGEQNN